MWLTEFQVMTSVIIMAMLFRNTKTLFREEQIIFASDFNISKILVPADGSKYVHADSSQKPTVFFTTVDPISFETCIYVLEDTAAYEILDGGRDSTSDYSFNKTVYFGGKDGLYKYEPVTLTAKKFGSYSDDIIQLQKVNGSDAFYILTKDNELYVIENNGTVKSRVHDVACASEFVLDTSNNVYFVTCNDHTINIMKPGEAIPITVKKEFNDVKLFRPPFMMEGCIPLLVEGTLHLLYVNGTMEKKNFHMKEKPSALSVDAALYIVVALNGKIYEFNVMDTLLRSMFGLPNPWPMDMAAIVTLMIQDNSDSFFEYEKLLIEN